MNKSKYLLSHLDKQAKEIENKLAMYLPSEEYPIVMDFMNYLLNDDITEEEHKILDETLKNKREGENDE